MSEEYSVEIVNPEKSFLSKNDVTEVVVPAFEGEIGILKDIDKEKISEIQKSAEEELNKSDINDQEKYLLDQKLEVLKSIN